MLSFSGQTVLATFLACTNLITALPTADSFPLQTRQQQLPSCNATSLKADTSVYAKESYLCNAAAGGTLNTTFALKTLDYPLNQSSVLGALLIASQDTADKNATNSNTEATYQGVHVVVQPFLCDGNGGWNYKRPTKEQLDAGLAGLVSLGQTSLKGKTLASGTAILSAGGFKVAAVQIQNDKTTVVPYVAQSEKNLLDMAC